VSVSITATRVAKRFHGHAVLQDLSLDVRPSEIVSLIGPSGCGKSTLLRLLSGLETEHSGRLTIDGHEVTGPRRSVGVMFQEPRLMPWLTVRENLLIGRPRDADELLRQVHLEGSSEILPRQLSGGMAQRVALARALAGEPGALLLDEPFSAVDALTRMSLQELLLSVWQRTRLTMLLVTHDLDEALFLGDRVVVMSARPASVKDIITVEVPRPRDRRDAELARLRVRLMEALHVAGLQPFHKGA
jgi:sulfonate transport system ATP-binding protein